MKTILLTGANGFVGKNLKYFLESKDYKIIAPHSKDFDFSNISIVKKLVADTNPDCFILSGFYGINTPTPPQDIFEKNLQILKNFISCSNGKKIITFGSGAEFDKSLPIIDRTDESWAKLPPQDLYGRAKYLISKEIKNYSNVLNLRLFGVYGPYEQDRRFITHAIKCVLDNQPITIRQNVNFSYLEITDLCKLVVYFIEHTPKHQFINMTPPKKVSLKTLAEIVKKISNSNVEIQILKQGFANEYTGIPKALLEEIPNFEFVSLEDGIKNLYNFIKDYYKK